MAHTTTKRAGLLAALAIALLTACGRDGIPLREDAELSAKIQHVQDSGGSARLKDLTGGDWDTVHIFVEDVTREWVEEDVGAPIDMGDISPGNSQILVFMKDGRPQRAVWTFPNNLREGRYTDRLVLHAVPGTVWLDIVDIP